ncbi:MAG: imidazoleglycerol-phosphate dehydratase HisB [Solirubrobacterales bacterium]
MTRNENRKASRVRKTGETEIDLSVDLDGGPVEISTGVGFFDHMLDSLARHSGMGLSVDARGDLDTGSHHTVEDVGIVLGQAVDEALGDRSGIRRFGSALVPMDEALAECALDLSGRGMLVFDAELPVGEIGGFEIETTSEFFGALAREGRLTVHLELRRGRNVHHSIEALFKGLALALRSAIEPVEGRGVPSTKGTLTS